MGKMLDIAFQDVEQKIQIILDLGKYYQIPNIFTLVQHEVKLGIEKLNGIDNHKFSKDPTLSKYMSASRTMLRMCWFLDFIY